MSVLGYSHCVSSLLANDFSHAFSKNSVASAASTNTLSDLTTPMRIHGLPDANSSLITQPGYSFHEPSQSMCPPTEELNQVTQTSCGTSCGESKRKLFSDDNDLIQDEEKESSSTNILCSHTLPQQEHYHATSHSLPPQQGVFPSFPTPQVAAAEKEEPRPESEGYGWYVNLEMLIASPVPLVESPIVPAALRRVRLRLSPTFEELLSYTSFSSPWNFPSISGPSVTSAACAPIHRPLPIRSKRYRSK